MQKTFFTIIVVSYNAGDELLKTIESICGQTFGDYRVLIKDGMSTDGSLDKLRKRYDMSGPEDPFTKPITLIESCDNGIYHAMNIATSLLSGKVQEVREKSGYAPEGTKEVFHRVNETPSYIFFLNCGDYFASPDVLEKVHDRIVDRCSKEGTTLPAIYYGDIYDRSSDSRVASNPKIDDHACYRNVPSHQACFYDERLIYGNPFDLSYKVRADYEHFLRCFYRDKAETVYMPVMIADYQGGGYSDKNKKISEKEREEIIKKYLPLSKIRKYDFLRIVTLAPLRTALASNKVTSGAYNGLKTAIYSLKNRKNNKE